MAADATYDELVTGLVTLGRAVPEPTPDDGLTVAVMARIADLPAPASPARRFLARTVDALLRRRRRVVVVTTAILLSLLAAPPVRATVADWFGFAGVIVRDAPEPGPSSAPPPPRVETTTSLSEAEALVAFTPLLPGALGPPEGIEVSADRRLLSMSWTDARGGVVRLDQFDARLDYTFAKRSTGVEFTAVGDAFALWFARPHSVVVLERDGTRRTETARLAGNTLIWQHNGMTTLRLEGDFGMARAVEIAETVAEVR